MKKFNTLKRVDWIAIIVAITVTVTALGAWAYLHDKTNQARTLKILERKQIELDIKLQELKKTQSDTKQLEEQKRELEKQLQAKREASERNKAYAATVTPKTVPARAVQVSGNHSDWMRAAGIPQEQWPAAEVLVQRESSWNVASRNSIGCIGLLQNCPDKYGHYWLTEACPNWQNDPVCQLSRFYVYAQARYGNFQNGLSHSYTHNWW